MHVMTQAVATDKSVAVLAEPADSDLGVELWQLDEGEALAKRFAKGARLVFDASYKGRKLVDLQTNAWGGFVVSPRLREILAEEPRIEFLPVAIADHKGKVVTTDYCLANFLSPVDCVDRSKSKCHENPLDRSLVVRIEKLVIDRKKVPAGRRAFRLSIRPQTVVLDDKMAAAIRSTKLTGIACIAEDDYDSTGLLGV